MKQFYDKNQLMFSLLLIVIYIIGSNVCENISKIFVIFFHAAFSLVLVSFICKNNLVSRYGLLKSNIPAGKFLYYIPLIILSTCSLWFGLSDNILDVNNIVLVVSMLLVGFLEEIIFRGFLFVSMAKGNIKSAIVVSSITFGIGHIINLFSGMNFVSNMCQCVEAIAFGFLFVVLFYRGKSLIPCICAHSTINMLSVFGTTNVNQISEIIISSGICLVVIIYIFLLLKNLPKPESEVQK